MAISREHWIRNLVGVAKDLGDSEYQRSRWLAPDAEAWERPAELLNVALDDYQLELFITEEGSKLSSKQLSAATAFLQQATEYDCGPTGWRDSREVLCDPVWERLRQTARDFVAAFQDAD
jgi:hypothetical protein